MLELLMVVIILGLLSAIALPTMVSQAAKARQSEAKIYIGTINRAQQAYMVETSKFADTLSLLSVSGSDQSKHYSYGVVVSSSQGSVTATPLAQSEVKAYVGATILVPDLLELETIICEAPSIDFGISQLPRWDSVSTSIQCPTAMVQVAN